MRSFLCALLCKACKTQQSFLVLVRRFKVPYTPIVLEIFGSLRYYTVVVKTSNQVVFFSLQIEEDLTTLQKKHSNLENEFDTVNEKYQDCQSKLEEAEKKASEVSRRRP